MELMHALISLHHGAAFAGEVSDWFLHTDIRAPGAPQRGGVAARHGAHSRPVEEAVSAMEDHVGDPLDLDQLALIAGVTPRHLGRLFGAAFGVSPMRFYRDLRLDIARRLARSTAMPIAAIAGATGFAQAGHLSRAYRQRFGLAPRADRRAPDPVAAPR